MEETVPHANTDTTLPPSLLTRAVENTGSSLYFSAATDVDTETLLQATRWTWFFQHLAQAYQHEFLLELVGASLSYIRAS